MFLIRYARELVASRKRIFILCSVAFVVVLGGLFFLFFGGKGTADKDAILKIIPENIDLQIRNFHYTEVGDENWSWEIDADTAKYAKKENLAYFDNVKMRLIRKDGKILTVTGKSGILHTDTKNARISGDVIAITNSGERVTTDHVDYADAEKKLYTEGPVLFTNAKLKIRGLGMTIMVNEQTVTLHSRVNAVYQR